MKRSQPVGQPVARPNGIQRGFNRAFTRLFGVKFVQSVRASGFQWLVGPEYEPLVIPDFASLAQRRSSAQPTIATKPALEYPVVPQTDPLDLPSAYIATSQPFAEPLSEPDAAISAQEDAASQWDEAAIADADEPLQADQADTMTLSSSDESTAPQPAPVLDASDAAPLSAELPFQPDPVDSVQEHPQPQVTGTGDDIEAMVSALIMEALISARGAANLPHHDVLLLAALEDVAPPVNRTPLPPAKLAALMRAVDRLVVSALSVSTLQLPEALPTPAGSLPDVQLYLSLTEIPAPPAQRAPRPSLDPLLRSVQRTVAVGLPVRRVLPYVDEPLYQSLLELESPSAVRSAPLLDLDALLVEIDETIRTGLPERLTVQLSPAQRAEIAGSQLFASLQELPPPTGYASTPAFTAQFSDLAAAPTAVPPVEAAARPTYRFWAATAVAAGLAMLVFWLWMRGQTPVATTPLPVAVSSPTALVTGLAVVNPENQAAVATASAPKPTASALPSVDEGTSAESVAPAITTAFPFSFDVVTPTPNSLQERQLFAEPLVALEAESNVVAPVARSAELPVILPAMAADGGGNPVSAPSLDELSRPRILPAMVFAQIPDRATPAPTVIPLPTDAPIVLAPGRAWSTFAPDPNGTHFWVGRPHPAFVENQIAAPSYQFGSSGGGRYRPHHGMDIANPFGTPVRAAVTGEVVHAGPDDPELIGPYNNFYGNTVVIRLDRRLGVAGGEMDVFLVYGHLSQVNVQKGQRVQPDDIVGQVGMTGIAIGPHLHVEMRVGSNTYEASVNPYLWVEPPPGSGAIAVRLLTADGRTWPRARLTVARFEGNVATWARVIEIYPDDESINPNPSWGENGAMEAVPAGTYFVGGVVNGERVSAQAVVEPGKTTFVEIRTAQ